MNKPYTPSGDYNPEDIDWRTCYNTVRKEYKELEHLFQCSNRVRVDELELYKQTLKELEQKNEQIEKIKKLLSEVIAENTTLRITFAGLNN